MSCPFKVSDKVVALITFVDDDPTFRCIGPMPVKGQVYVIAAILGPWTDDYGIALSSSTVIMATSGQETGFNCRRFRKLEEVQAENRAKASESVILRPTPQSSPVLQIGP